MDPMGEVTAVAILSIALSIAAGLGATASAQPTPLLGSCTVADLSETDVISVPGGQGFSSIRLCVA